MSSALGDATRGAGMRARDRTLRRRILEHFVRPAQEDAGNDAYRLHPGSGSRPSAAWPAAWTAPGVADDANAAGVREWLPPAAPADGLEHPPPAAPPDTAIHAAHTAAGAGAAARRPRAIASRIRSSGGAWRPRRVVVLGVPDAVGPVAAAVANEVRGRQGAVLAAWSPRSASTEDDVPATWGARRLVAQLAAAGHDAIPRGRLAWVALPCDPRAAATAYAQLAAAAPAPTVLAVAGPRPDAFTPLLREAELVALIAGPGDALVAEVALASLAGLPSAVVTVAPPAGPARLLAAAGFGRMPPIRDALRARVVA